MHSRKRYWSYIRVKMTDDKFYPVVNNGQTEEGDNRGQTSTADKQEPPPPSYKNFQDGRLQGSVDVGGQTTTQPTMTQQQPQGQAQIYVVTTPILIGKHSQLVQCPNCRAEIMTRTNHDSGVLTWLMCAGLCLIGCDAGCCLIPFCLDSCKDVIHECPNCNYQIGKRKLIW